ncbi:unnamed protein product [Gordionus sp. m RMFG-2023]
MFQVTSVPSASGLVTISSIFLLLILPSFHHGSLTHNMPPPPTIITASMFNSGRCSHLIISSHLRPAQHSRSYQHLYFEILIQH